MFCGVRRRLVFALICFITFGLAAWSFLWSFAAIAATPPSPVSFLDTFLASKDNHLIAYVRRMRRLEQLAVTKMLLTFKYPAADLPGELLRLEHQLLQSSGGRYPEGILKLPRTFTTKASPPALRLDVYRPAERVLEGLLKRMGAGNIWVKRFAVIDVGANLGQFALPLAKQGLHVTSFEPAAATCQNLTANIRAASVEKLVDVHCFAVGENSTEISFGYYGAQATAPSSFRQVDPTRKDAHVVNVVRSEPMSNVEVMPPGSTMFLFKTDTQGYEEQVLRGSRSVIERHRPKFLLVEVSCYLLRSQGSGPKQLLQLIYEMGYICTHTAIQSRVAVAPEKMYRKVDLPKKLQKAEPGMVSFDEFESALCHDNEYSYKGKPIPAEARSRYAWTDALCF